MLCIFQTSLKKYPFPGRGSALGRRRRRRWGYMFKIILKLTPFFHDFVLIGKTWIFKKSGFKPRRRSPRYCLGVSPDGRFVWMPGDLHPLVNPEILKIQVLLILKNVTLLNFKII